MTYLLLVFFLSSLTRLLPLVNANPDFDTYGHLYFAKEVKDQQSKPWGAIKLKVWGGGVFHHPFYWHWLVGFFSINKVLKYQKWINAILDIVFTVCLYLVMLELGLGTTEALLGVLLYLFTPMWFSRLSTGPRVTSLTPRLASEIFLNVVFIIIILNAGQGIDFYIVLAMILCSLVVLSSKFGIQALLFLGTATSMLTPSVELLLVFVGGFALAVAVTGGQIVPSLREQLRHLTLYYKKNRSGLAAISNRNSHLASKLLANLQEKKWQEVIKLLLITNSYTAVIFKMPMLLVLFSFLMLGEVGIDRAFIVPIFASVLVYLIVNHPKLLFLGEAERYLNHVALLIVISSVMVASETNLYWPLWLLVFYGIGYWLAEIVLFIFMSPGKKRDEADRVVEEFLLRDNKPRLILSYPYHAVGIFRIMLCTPHHVIYSVNMNGNTRESFVEKFEADYPYIRLDKLDDLVAETDLNTLILRRHSLVARGYADWCPSPSQGWLKKDLPQSEYDVYERALS